MLDTHLFLESFGPNTVERLRAVVTAAKDGDPLRPVTVVVPTPYAGISLRRSLGASIGLTNVRFMVMSRLAEFLGSPFLAEQGKAPLSSLMEQATIRALAQDMADVGPLGPVALQPSLHASLGSTFRDLDRLDERGLEKLARIDSLRQQTVEWYQACRNRLDGYYTREDLARSAGEALRQPRATATLRDLGTIVFFLLDRLSPAESDLINGLCEIQPSYMVLGLTGEELADATTMGSAAAAEPFFGAPDQGSFGEDDFKATHLLSAPDAQEEIRWIVRDLVRRAEAGTLFHKIAIFYRHAGAYGPMIRSQLKLAGIPAAGPDPSSLKDSPAGRMIDFLIGVYESDYGRDAVMACAAESPLKVSGAGDSFENLVHWETISRKAGVLQGLDQWEERISRYRSSLNARIVAAEAREEVSVASISGLKDLASSAGSLLAFVRALAKNEPPTPGSKWSAFAQWSKNLVDDFGIHPEQWPEQHAASYDRVIQTIDDLAGLDGVTNEATLQEFRTTLDGALAVSAGRIGSTGAGVFVANLDFARGMEFEAIYLVGMSEGAFPPPGREDPLIPDQIRAELDAGTTLPLRRSTAIDERRSYISALASGIDRTLCYARSDPSSRQELHPSAWFLQAASTLNESQVGSKDLGRLGGEEWLTVIQSLEHSLDFAESIGAADVHDRDVADVAAWRRADREFAGHFLAVEGTRLGRSRNMEQARQSSGFTPWDGNLTELAGQSRRLALPATAEVSPTRLEQWAGCPFRYFLGYVLNISSQERPEELTTISAMDRGNVIHDILEQFVVQATGDGHGPDFGGPWNPEHRKLMLQIAEVEFEKAENSGVTGKELLWQAVKAEITDDMLGFLEADNRWRQSLNSRPVWAERSFGSFDPKGSASVELSLPDGETLKFRGRIDRIDEVEGQKLAIVIDYKSGSSSSYDDMKDDPLGAGTHLQLPVYALAARQLSAEADDVLAAYWFVTNRGNFRREEVFLSAIEDRFIEVIETIASNITKGVFPANPGASSGRDGGPRNCSYCDFDRVCPSNRRLLWERKSPSPEIAPYLNLTIQKGDEEVTE